MAVAIEHGQHSERLFETIIKLLIIFCFSILGSVLAGSILVFGIIDNQLTKPFYGMFNFFAGIDIPLAIEWYSKAAQQGSSVAQVRLGLIYYLGEGVEQDMMLAQQWFEKAALQGHPRAFEILGRIYYLGHGVEQDDVMAFKWFTLARAAGDKSSRAAMEVLSSRMNEVQVAQGEELVAEWNGARQSSHSEDLVPEQ